MILRSRLPVVAPAATVIGTDKEVRLEAVSAPTVMPLVPLTSGDKKNSTRLEPLKLVLAPLIVRVGVELVALPPGVTELMPGIEPPEVAATFI